MRTNLENPRIHEPRITGLRLSNVVIVLTQTLIIPEEGPTLWLVDGGAADRAVRLPTLAREKQVVISNVGATHAINVTDAAGAALTSLAVGTIGIFFAGSSRWVYLVSASLNSIATSVVLASGAIANGDIDIQVNSAGVVVLTIPASAAWAAASGWTGFPLSIYDVSGNASVNNITLNPSGGETFSGMASLTIGNDYGGYRLRPISGGSGWIVL